MFMRCGVVLLLGLMLAACNESTEPDSNLVSGAGIRFVFPAGSENLTGVRVELWDVGENASTPIPSPDCSVVAKPGFLYPAGVLSPASARTDSCTHMRVDIRNWVGDETLSIPDTTFHGSLAWGWDQTDDAGNPVPPGIYTIESDCLDSQGSFTFAGYYYVVSETPSDSCKWILWSENLSGRQLDNAEFGPFLTIGKTETIYEEQNRQVGFLNPFTVRVLADGMKPYEQEINLTDGKYTDVAVTFTPLETP